MKKTLFLSAILATALCSSAFGATDVSVGENQTRDISTELTSGGGINLTLANGATVTNTTKSYAAGGNWDKGIGSLTMASGATATLDVTGTANDTGFGFSKNGLAEVAIDLNGGTLIKTGSGQTIMYHVTTGTSTGTIQVDNGRLRFDGTGYAFHGDNASFVVNQNGSLFFNNLETTMKSLTNNGTVIVNSGSTTTVQGTFTTNAGSETTINNTKTLTVKALNTTGGVIQGAGTLFVDANTTENNTTLDFDYISQTAGTKLSLKQAHGTLKAADTAIANNITLTNGSWAAAEWVNVEGSSYTFNGAISGSGNQVFSGKNGLKEVDLTFNGNLSGWTSSGNTYNGLRAAGGMTLNVTLGGSLTGNNAIVSNAFNADSDSKLNLTIDREATLKGTSNITSLTVNSNKTAKLQGTATIGSMTLTSQLNLLDGANLTTSAFTGTLKVAGNSTINLKGNGGTINNSGAHTATINVGGNSDVSMYAIYEDTANVGRGTFNVVLNNAGHKTTVTNWLTVKNVTIKNGEDLSLAFHTIENLNVEKGVSTVSTTANIGGNQHVIRNVTVAGGASLTFDRQGAASVTSLTLGSGATVTLGSAASHNHDLTTTTLTVDGSSTLNANLVVNDNGVMDFSNHTELTMGCTVSIGDHVTIMIDDSELADIMSGNSVMTIINDVEGVNMDNLALTLGSGWKFVDAHGNSLDAYNLRLDVVDAGEGKVNIVVAPEPATATLSLLALAALAARRKRH